MGPNAKLYSDQGDVMDDPGKYRRLVGKLNYLTVTRPDISLAVSTVSQFMSFPRLPQSTSVLTSKEKGCNQRTQSRRTPLLARIYLESESRSDLDELPLVRTRRSNRKKESFFPPSPILSF